MNVLIAPDKFKGSLSAHEVCDAINEGLKRHRNIRTTLMPLADGGDGTLAVLSDYIELELIRKNVSGPLFDRIPATYGFVQKTKSAFIEMAQVAGLQLLREERRNPLKATTLGMGELILDALDHGAKNITLTIGGSATNDAGIGMASALGYEFLDRKGDTLLPIGESLSKLYYIRSDAVDPRITNTTFTALYDVMNPLFGANGAAYIFAPQKGADKSAVQLLDIGLQNFDDVISRVFKQTANFRGAGAGGGIAAGAKIFLNANVVPGMQYLSGIVGLEEKIRKADLIITGEGKLDNQSFTGKVVGELVERCQRLKKKVVIVCGINELESSEYNTRGIEKVIDLSRQGAPELTGGQARERIVKKISEEIEL